MTTTTLQSRLAAVRDAGRFDDVVIGGFARYIAEAPDEKLFRMNPYRYAAETGISGPTHFDVISTGQSKYALWTVEKQDAAGLWLPDQVVHNITIDPPPCEAGPWTV